MRIGIPVKHLTSKFGAPAIVIVHPEPGGVDIAIDTMRPTEEVMVCEQREDGTGEWAGIIYGGTRERCRLASAPHSARAYAGPCRSGWIEVNHLIGSGAATDQ